jgi:Ca-activated chloride channel homolog
MRLGAAFLIAVVLLQDPVLQLRVDVPLVSVDVKVLDSRGQPMTSLTAKDFIIAEDGVEQQVASFTSIDTPYNILLLFDRSGSTEELWTTMQRSADRFVRNLRSHDRVALAAFDEGVMMLSGWNDSRDAARRALDELSDRGPGGGTNLYQSLERVTQREFYNTNGRRAVVVLTDGRDTALLYQSKRGNGLSDPVFQRTANIVRASRVPVYFVALNTDKNRNGGAGGSETLIREARARMELLADVSGGGIFFPRGTREIVDVYDQVSRDLSSSYSLAYTSTHSAVPGQTHRIEIRVHGASVKQSRNEYITR